MIVEGSPMAKAELPPPSVLRKLLRYDSETGALVWLSRDADDFGASTHSRERKAAAWNARNAGTPALNANAGRGYLGGRIFDKAYKAHRVAWAVHYGEWPQDHIDHINHDRKDNRIANLRVVTSEQNNRNTKLSSTNTSGVNGVSWCQKSKRWAAYIRVADRKIHLGQFRNIEDAEAARRKANAEYGFHENHGKELP
jgi:hypothetical protein